MAPLSGIRIVEIDAIGPVPFAAMLLAGMGAAIVRIARPGGQAAFDDLGETIIHRGRSGITLDLKSTEGRESALKLIGEADALLEGFRPGVMERLGLGPEACLAVNPKLVFARMTGWGQTGLLAARAGHDINYIALSGALAAIGEEGRPPSPPLNLVGDYGGGAMFLVSGVLAAIIEAQRTGRGQVVDVAMVDGAISLMSMFLALRQNGHWSDRREDNLLDGGAPFYRCYACSDGRYVAVGAIEPPFFRALLDGLGFAPDAFRQHDRTQWPAMTAAFAERLATRSRDEWAAHFGDTDACVTPVLDMLEAARHPHNVARAAHIELDGILHPTPAPRFADMPTLHPARVETVEQVLARWGKPRN